MDLVSQQTVYLSELGSNMCEIVSDKGDTTISIDIDNANIYNNHYQTENIHVCSE